MSAGYLLGSGAASYSHLLSIAVFYRSKMAACVLTQWIQAYSESGFCGADPWDWRFKKLRVDGTPGLVLESNWGESRRTLDQRR